jgi:hypothetical protein
MTLFSVPFLWRFIMRLEEICKQMNALVDYKEYESNVIILVWKEYPDISFRLTLSSMTLSSSSVIQSMKGITTGDDENTSLMHKISTVLILLLFELPDSATSLMDMIRHGGASEFTFDTKEEITQILNASDASEPREAIEFKILDILGKVK